MTKLILLSLFHILILSSLPRSSRVREPHDDAVGDGSPLAEVVVETLLRGGVVQTSKEKLLRRLSFVLHCVEAYKQTNDLNCTFWWQR